MRIDHWNRVSMSIRFKINLLDQKNRGEDDVEEDSRPGDTILRKESPFKSGHIILGAAAQKIRSFDEVSAAHSDDPAFAHLKNKFNHFIHTNFNSAEFINDNEDLPSIPGSATVKSVCLHILNA
jgi:hypothetical protein